VAGKVVVSTGQHFCLWNVSVFSTVIFQCQRSNCLQFSAVIHHSKFDCIAYHSARRHHSNKTSLSPNAQEVNAAVHWYYNYARLSFKWLKTPITQVQIELQLLKCIKRQMWLGILNHMKLTTTQQSDISFPLYPSAVAESHGSHPMWSCSTLGRSWGFSSNAVVWFRNKCLPH
jgi:hypothetical protein